MNKNKNIPINIWMIQLDSTYEYIVPNVYKRKDLVCYSWSQLLKNKTKQKIRTMHKVNLEKSKDKVINH